MIDIDKKLLFLKCTELKALSNSFSCFSYYISLKFYSVGTKSDNLEIGRAHV